MYHWKGLNDWFVSCLLGYIRDKCHNPTSAVRDGEMGWIETSNGCDWYLAIELLSAAQKITWNAGQRSDSCVDGRFSPVSLKRRSGQRRNAIPLVSQGLSSGYLVNHPGDNMFVVAPRCLKFLRQALDQHTIFSPMSGWIILAPIEKFCCHKISRLWP